MSSSLYLLAKGNIQRQSIRYVSDSTVINKVHPCVSSANSLRSCSKLPNNSILHCTFLTESAWRVLLGYTSIDQGLNQRMHLPTTIVEFVRSAFLSRGDERRRCRRGIRFPLLEVFMDLASKLNLLAAALSFSFVAAVVLGMV